MSLLEEVLKAREEAEQKPPCQKCKYLFWIDEETPFCKEKDKFILPELPPNKCELRRGRRLNNVRLEKKPLEITLNLIKQMKDDTEASVSIEVAMSLVDTIEALQQENEQLQAQVAKMSGKADCTIAQLETQNKVLLEQLANIHGLQSNVTVSIPADYHNPADVEALRKARNLLQRYKDHIKSYPCECKFGLDFYGNKTPFRDGEMCERCAELAEIDKAIGGKEDE